MEAVAQLMAIEAIKHLKARYWYYVDTKAWDAWVDLFTSDGAFQWDSQVSALGRDGMPGEKYAGREGLAKVGKVLEGARTVHRGHAPIIDVVSETEARAIWPMEDIVDRADHELHGWGHYHETYEKVDGRWLIKTSHLHRQRMQTISR
jgi:hypothetical protein